MSFYGLVLTVFVLAIVSYLAYFLGELNYLNEIWLAYSSAVAALHAYQMVVLGIALPVAARASFLIPTRYN